MSNKICEIANIYVHSLYSFHLFYSRFISRTSSACHGPTLTDHFCLDFCHFSLGVCFYYCLPLLFPPPFFLY
jgi:hypothetical protein